MENQLYKKVAENAPFGYAYYKIILDENKIPADYKFIEVNKAFEESTGLKRENILQKNATTVFPDIREDKFDRIALFGKIALEGGKKSFYHYEKRFNKYYLIVVHSPKKYYFVTSFIDITEQRQAEEKLKKINEEYIVLNEEYLSQNEEIKATNEELIEKNQKLKESEERYKGINQNTLSCIAVYKAIDNGENFVFVDFNPMAEKVEQISKNEVIGKKVTEVFPGVIEFGLFKVFQDVWKTGNPKHFPVLIYQDERIQGYRENYVYKLASGEIVAVYQDLTDRKQAEEELKKRMSELEIFNDASVNRELMINDLRKEINLLLNKLGDKPKYDIVE